MWVFQVSWSLPVATPPAIAPGAVVGHQFAQDALAQAAIGDPEAFGRPDGADRLENGAAGEHQIGAVGADAGIGDALLKIPADQPLDHGIDAVAVHPQPVDAASVVTLEVEMHAGKGRDRAGSAEQVEFRACNDVPEAVAPFEGFKVGGDVVDHHAHRTDVIQLVEGQPLVYGQSITDGCIDWDSTVQVLERLAEAVRMRRRARLEAAA